MDHHGSTSAAASSSQDPGIGTRNAGEGSSGQHTQACRRCREQKLRCSRDLPICKRCERISAICAFPDPPDRKLLATQRIRKPRVPRGKRSKPYTGAVEGNEAPTHESSPPTGYLADLGHALPSDEDLNIFPGNSQLQEGDYSIPEGPELAAHELISSDQSLPSAGVSLQLIEVYFDSVYNAALLFHKESFLSDYAAKKIPNFVLLSIFALASIFLRKPRGRILNDESAYGFGTSILSLPEFSGRAVAWATAATQQVMMQADQPRPETIQACQNLTLYWFSINQITKTHMLSNIAYTTSSMLGYHALGSGKDQTHSFDTEKKRRCFWSCWITSCIGQDNAHFKGESWAAVVGLPFPSDERHFAAGKPDVSEAFDEEGRVMSLLQLGTAPRPSYFGELVKLFSLWWEIQSFVRRHLNETSNDSSAVLVNLLILDRKLELIFEKLHSHFKYTGSKSFTSKSPIIDTHQLFALNSLYQLCSCVLHSSIVPLFSSEFPDVEISKKLIKMCAEEAVKNSSTTLEMANAFLNTHPNEYRFSGITAYAMFVSSTIQMRSLRAQRKLRTHVSNLRGAVSIVRRVKDFWYPVRGMWTNLESAFRSTGMNVNDILAEDDHWQLVPIDTRTDIDQIISNNATSEQGTVPDIYTYAPSQVPKGKSSQKSASSHASPATDVNSNPGGSISYRPRINEGSGNNEDPLRNDGEQLHSDVRFTSGATSRDQQVSNPRNFYFNQDQKTSPFAAVGSDAYPSPTAPQSTDGLAHGQHLPAPQTIPDGGEMSTMNFMEDFNAAYHGSGMDMMDSGNEFWWDQSFEGLDRDPFGLLRGGFPQPMEGMWFEPPT